MTTHDQFRSWSSVQNGSQALAPGPCSLTPRPRPPWPRPWQPPTPLGSEALPALGTRGSGVVSSRSSAAEFSRPASRFRGPPLLRRRPVPRCSLRATPWLRAGPPPPAARSRRGGRLDAASRAAYTLVRRGRADRAFLPRGHTRRVGKVCGAATHAPSLHAPSAC